jgi:hypothetical protein
MTKGNPGWESCNGLKFRKIPLSYQIQVIITYTVLFFADIMIIVAILLLNPKDPAKIYVYLAFLLGLASTAWCISLGIRKKWNQLHPNF